MIKKWLRKWLGIVDHPTPLTVSLITDLQRQINQIPRFTLQDALPEDSVVYLLANHVNAIKKHLGIEIKWNWKDDPNYAPAPHPQIREFTAVKSKPKKKVHGR